MKVILFLFLFILFFIFFHESYFLIIAFLINMTFSVFRIHSDFLKILIFFKDILIKREIVGVKGKNNIDIQNENKT